jgi:ribosome biogenesis GTPase
MIKNETLKKYGWDEFFSKQFEPFSSNGYTPCRVAVQNKTNYLLYTHLGEFTGEISGRFLFEAETKGDFPAVGDWVAARLIEDEKKAIIDIVLNRKNKFSRKSAGVKTEEQVIASNIDVLFIMSSLNLDLKTSRIERYLTLAYENDVEPVIILSKSDLCCNVLPLLNSVRQVSGKVPVHVISSIKHTGIAELKNYFTGYKTAAIAGSSGVGKTTLINELNLNAGLNVKEITGYKDRGVHTTTRREMILLPSGGIIIDTPGLRELQLWGGDEGLKSEFMDIEELARQCKFSDCSHQNEPGCAVKQALKEGSLSYQRYKSYKKLQREVNYFEKRAEINNVLLEKRRWKKIALQAKKISKYKREQ